MRADMVGGIGDRKALAFLPFETSAGPGLLDGRATEALAAEAFSRPGWPQAPGQRGDKVDVMMIGLRGVGAGQGGVESHVDKLSAALDRLGLKVEIVARSPFQPTRYERDAGTTIVPLWSPRRTGVEALVHSVLAVGYAAWRRPQVLHIHAIGPSLVAPLARLAGLKVVVTHHGEDYNREKWGPVARLLLRAGEACGALVAHGRIAVSSSLRDTLCGRFGRAFAYIPSGVTLPERSGAAGPLSILADLGLEPGRYILNVGRLVPEKRQLDLIDALDRLEDPGIKLVLVGGMGRGSAYSRALAERAVGNPRVILAGVRTGRALAELYANAGVFALPSSHEGLSLALLEAMAHGNKVVASAIVANRNLGLPAQCYCPCGDIPALTDALRGALAQGGLARVDWSEMLEPFCWDRIAVQTIRVYRSAAGRARPPREPLAPELGEA